MTGRAAGPVRPPSLRRGARVAVIAPGSRILDTDALEAGLARLRRMGLEPVEGPHLRSARGDLAGTDRERAADLAWALGDPGIDAVWAARGGWGTLRTLDALGRLDLPDRPRWVAGFSDLTPLLDRLVERGWICLHAPTVCALAGPRRHVASDLSGWLLEGRRRAVLEVGRSRCLVGGRAAGRLTGGCLSLIAAVAGTPWAPDLSGAIVLLEDVGEPPYRIDRMLWQLRGAGMLGGVRGLAFGQFTACGAPAGRPSRSLRAVLADHARALGVPALAGIPVGHGPRSRAVPLGAHATLDADRARLVVTCPAPARR
ncbi:MAG: LD-carboxypeptidase [Acidobacteriota bacterium]